MKRLDIDQGAERALNLPARHDAGDPDVARACGKSDVHHLEPEDMAALTMEASNHLRCSPGRHAQVFRKIGLIVFPVEVPKLRASEASTSFASGERSGKDPGPRDGYDALFSYYALL